MSSASAPVQTRRARSSCLLSLSLVASRPRTYPHPPPPAHRLHI